MLLAHFAQARRTHFFAHFNEELAVETEGAAFREHGGEASNIDGVLTLVVSCAAPVDTLALDSHPPR
jgi:hypothetical protein